MAGRKKQSEQFSYNLGLPYTDWLCSDDVVIESTHPRRVEEKEQTLIGVVTRGQALVIGHVSRKYCETVLRPHIVNTKQVLVI